MNAGSMIRQLFNFMRPSARRFPRLAMAYRTMRDTRNLFSVPEMTPLGFVLTGNTQMQRGLFEIEETKIVGSILDHVDVLINVGANIGYYCCLGKLHGKQIVAFEPIQNNVRYLLRNLESNGWNRGVEIYPLALSNHTGIIWIYGSGTAASLVDGWAGASGYNVRLVPASTMDTILGSRFIGTRILIIVDIEGAEYAMLQGSASYLSADPKPIWMVEISVSKHQPNDVSINPHFQSTFEMFWKLGYEARSADQELRLIFPDEVSKIAKGGTDTLGTNNFLFLEEGLSNVIRSSKYLLNT